MTRRSDALSDLNGYTLQGWLDDSYWMQRYKLSVCRIKLGEVNGGKEPFFL